MTVEPEKYPNDHDLHKRLDELEHVVSQLQAQLHTVLDRLDASEQTNLIQSRPAPSREQRKTAVSQPPSPRVKQELSEPKPYLQGDFWLNKIGIALILFALAFLFKFAIDQGWLTPTVRVVIGLVLGTTLLLFGLRLHSKRRAFAVVLLGGSMASYYITGFAAFQLYELVSFLVAFSFMIVVSLLTFSLSIRQDEAILALIGTLGGFATPFLLYTGGSNVPGLIFYTCILMVGTVAIYFYKGWRVLLWGATLLGWIVLWVGLDAAVSRTAVSADKWAVQVGLVLAWLAFWGVPILRQVLMRNGTSKLSPLTVGLGDRYLPQFMKQWAGFDLHVYAITAVFLLLLSTIPLWNLEQTEAGWLFAGFALLYGLIAFTLYWLSSLRNLGITHAIAATLLLTFAFLILLDDEILLLALTAEVIIWQFFNTRLKNKWVTAGVHFFSGIVAFWMLVRLTTGETTSKNTAVRVATDLVVIISYASIALVWLPLVAKRLYLLAVHIAILLFFWRELSDLTNGQGLVSVAWGVYAITLLIIGLRYRINECRLAGLTTLFILVAKLFLIDLSEVKAIWRILLFFGFGGAFMLLSYFYQMLWRSNTPTIPEEPIPKT